MKKALLISVKAGYGHHSTAQAMINYFKEHGVECDMLDTFEYISPLLGNSIQDGYIFFTKYFPDIYGSVYNKLDKKDEAYARYSPMMVASKAAAKKISEYVVSYGADAIIGTHSYACMLISYMKNKEWISCPTYGVVTDFTVHPFWESTKLDYYITADSLLDNQMIKKGITKDKILPFGIPIKSKFSQKIDKKDACRELGIEDKPTILVMMGSMGFGNIINDMKKITSVEGDFQVLCVCGNNEKALKTVESAHWDKKVYAYGFVDNVDVMMDAADCIITKPGGLTTSELMAKGLPAILVNPIPGQEDRNMEFLVNSGAGIMITKTFPMEEALYQLMNHPWRREVMRESVIHLGKPNSTRDLCEFIMNH